jgi:hypothetical protein
MQHKFTLRYKTFTDLGPALMSVEREKISPLSSSRKKSDTMMAKRWMRDDV